MPLSRQHILLPAALTAAASLNACSQQAQTPAVPAAPEISVPAMPDSATQVMRISDIDFLSYSRDLAKFVKLELGESMSSATPKIESYFSPQGNSVDEKIEYAASSGKKTETEFSTFGAQGGKVTLVERVNIKDDSIKAEQFYAIFKAKGEGFALADYGMKVKCHRGNNTDNWQTDLCP